MRCPRAGLGRPRLSQTIVGALALATAWGAPAAAGQEDTGEQDTGEQDTGEDEQPPGEEIVVEDRDISQRTDAQATSASVTIIEVDGRLAADSDVSTVVDSASGTTVKRLGGLGDWSGVSIRGSTTRQVQVSLDGIPLNPDGAAAVNLSELPLWAFQRVEIFRGNAPPELAAAPVGGVVHLRTGDRPAGVGLSGAYGSLRTGKGTALLNLPGTLLGQPVDALLIADAFTTRGDFEYFDDNGTEYDLSDDRQTTRSNNEKGQLNTHLRLRVGDESLRLSLLSALLLRNEGLPGHANNPTEAVRLDTTRTLTALSLDAAHGLWRGRVQSWALLRGERYDDRQGELGVGTQYNDDRFRSLGALGHGQVALGTIALPSLTVSVRQDRFVTTDLLNDADSGAARRLAVTPSAATDLFLWEDRITLSPVASWLVLDSHALGASASSDDSAASETDDLLVAFTPRAGLLVRPIPALALKANIARTLRPPDFDELFGDRGAIIGNPDLSPEQGLQWDVGVRVEAPDEWEVRGSAEVGHFWNSVQDMIVMVQNAQGTLLPLNLDDAWVQGVEAAATVDWRWLSLQSNLTRTASVNLSTQAQYANNQLPRVPTWELYQATAVHHAEQVRLGHSFSYTDGNYWDRTNFYRSAPRALHGAFLRAQPLAAWPSAELSVLNLFDNTEQTVPRNPLDPDDDSTVVQPLTDFVGYPLPGRTFLFTLRWQAPARTPATP